MECKTTIISAPIADAIARPKAKRALKVPIFPTYQKIPFSFF